MTFTKETFLGKDAYRFIHFSDVPKLRKGKIDRKFDRLKKKDAKLTNNSDSVDFKLGEFAQERLEAKKSKEAILSDLSVHNTKLSPILDRLITDEEEYNAANSMKKGVIDRRHKKTVRGAVKDGKSAFEGTSQDYEEALLNFRESFKTSYQTVKENAQIADHRVEELQQLRQSKSKLYDLSKEFAPLYKDGNMPSKRVKEKLQGTKDSHIQQSLAYLKEAEALDDAIENAQTSAKEWADLQAEFDGIDAMLKTRKDGYTKEKFSERTLTLKEKKKLRAFFTKNAPTALRSDVKAFAEGNYEAAKNVSEMVRNIEEENGIIQLQIQLKEAQDALNDWNNKPESLKDEAWEKKQALLEEKVFDLQSKLDASKNSAGEKASELLQQKSQEFDQKSIEVDEKAQLAREDLEKQIAAKKAEARESYARYHQHDPDIMQELQILEEQKDLLESQEFLDPSLKGASFEAYTNALQEKKDLEKYIQAFQKELSANNIEYTGGYSLNTNEVYSCNIDISPASKSRIERAIHREIQTQFDADFKALEKLSVQYGQKKAEISILEQSFRVLDAQREICNDDQCKADLQKAQKSLETALKEQEKIEKNIKETVKTIKQKQKTFEAGLQEKMFDLKLKESEVSLDPKASASAKKRASLARAEAQAKHEISGKILDDMIAEASQGLPQYAEKLKYEFCLDQALETLKQKGNYEGLKEANRQINLLNFDLKDASTLAERRKASLEIQKYKKEFQRYALGLKKDIQEVMNDLRNQKNSLEKELQTLKDADDANTDYGKKRIEMAENRLKEMTERMTFVGQGLCREYYELTNKQLGIDGYKAQLSDCNTTVTSCAHHFQSELLPSYARKTVSLKKSQEKIPGKIEAPKYFPEGFANRMVSNLEWATYPTSVQKFVAENREMVTPVKKTKSGVDLTQYGNVVEITPVNLDSVPVKEYSPRYYQVQPDGKLVFLTQFPVKNGERFGFQMEETPQTLQEKLDGMGTFFENRKDYEEAEIYLDKAFEEYSELGTDGKYTIVKRYTTGPKFRMVISPSNNPESELYRQEYTMEYDPVEKKWALDTSGLSEVEKKELKKEGITEKSITRGKFADIIHNFSRKLREDHVKKDPSFGVQMSNWWERLSWSPKTWFDFS